MHETRAWPRIAFGALAASSLLAGPGACGAANRSSSNATPMAMATIPATQPAPAYGAPPPGYPGTYPSAPPPPAAPAYGAPPAAAPAYGSPAPYTAPPAYSQPLPALPAPAGYPNAQPPPPAAAPPAAGSASAGTSGALPPADPNSLQAILAGIQGALQGVLVMPGSLPNDLVEAGLKAHALRVAPGMQPEGEQLKQSLTEGQHAVMMVTLQAGKCYAIVGFSPPGSVKDLDLNLLAPPLYITLAGQDTTHDRTPSIGGSPSPMCPVIALPLQYKLDVFARHGAGPVAVQLYSKVVK
jgi:hypothetical protein